MPLYHELGWSSLFVSHWESNDSLGFVVPNPKQKWKKWLLVWAYLLRPLTWIQIWKYNTDSSSNPSAFLPVEIYTDTVLTQWIKEVFLSASVNCIYIKCHSQASFSRLLGFWRVSGVCFPVFEAGSATIWTFLQVVQ